MGIRCCVFLKTVSNFLVPLASSGPLLSHIDPPIGPSCPKVAIWCDLWVFGVALELILATVGDFVDV